MEIHNISNLPSDPDITVILVKKSLDQCQDSKSGDGKNFSANTSLVNFAAHTQEGKDDTSSILSPVSSWDVDSIRAVDRCDPPARTLPTSSLSYNNEDLGLFRICESPKSSHSAVALKTIQNSYTESEPEDYSECNNSTFVDVHLGEPYVDENAQDKNRPAVMDKLEIRRKRKTPFSACFPCMFKSKINDDD